MDIFSQDRTQSSVRTLEIYYWIGVFGLGCIGWLLPLPSEQSLLLAIILIVSLIVMLIQFHWIRPRYGNPPWADTLGAYLTILFLASFAYLYKPYSLHIEYFYIAVIAGRSLRMGRTAALKATLVAAIIQGAITWMSEYQSPGAYLALVINVGTIGMVGYIIGEIGNSLHLRSREHERQNKHLSILLEAGKLAARPQPLEEILPQVAAMIAQNVPVTVSRISLLNPRNQTLMTYGVFPLRKPDRMDIEPGDIHSLRDLPEIQNILEQGDYRLFNHIDLVRLRNNSQRASFYFNGVSQMCIFPLIGMGRKVGLITVGEARHSEREPFTPEKIELLKALSAQIASAIHNMLLVEDAQRHARRMDMLNAVSRAISSTIELNDLLELIYQQLSIVIPSDSYFVGLEDPDDGYHDVRILVDEGQRFPPLRLALGQGLMAWVVKNRRPLLVRHVSQDAAALGIEPMQVGQERISETWLGAPMLAGDRYLGLLALASYTPNMFDQDDLNLIASVASQAALSLDNARQHAQVKEQARRDSLTGVYNHGYFLTLLDASVEQARQSSAPVALIMLDIDYFKQYNDRHGHVTGDEVLLHLSRSMRANIQEKDFIGRWGGEEFAIGLPGSTPQEAFELAERIRVSLSQGKLQDKRARDVISPTISQGIAVFPQHAAGAADLVDVADAALYEAKNAGRNQIIIAG